MTGTKPQKGARRTGPGKPRPWIETTFLGDLLGYQLRQAQVTAFQGFAAGTAGLDITPGQYGVLALVSANPGINQSGLARALGIDRSTMVPLIDGLEARGLVERRTAPGDRRSHAMTLTGPGRTLLARLRPRVEAHERNLAGDLSAAERGILLRLLRRLRPPEPDRWLNVQGSLAKSLAHGRATSGGRGSMLAGEILRQSAARLGDKPAIVCDGVAVSYNELDAAADRFAAALAGAGIGKGARVGMLCANDPAWGSVWFGTARAGAVLVTLSPRATVDDLHEMIRRTGLALVVAGATLADTARQALDGFDPRPRLVLVPEAGAPVADAGSLDAFVAGATAPSPDIDIVETDPVAITFTGGTTGRPKAVVVSHRARYTNNLTATVEFGIDEQDVMGVVTPLFHAAGLLIWFQFGILTGNTCVLLRSWHPETFMAAVERDGITTALLVPTQLRDLIRHPGFDPARLRNLRLVHYAAAPMPPEVIATALERLPGIEFIEHLGQSETGPIAIRPPEFVASRPDSVGRPAHGVEVRVVNAEGVPVAPGEIGEVITRGPHLLSEYLDDPEETRALFRRGDDWLWTGDLATMDKEGFISLVDRSKDMIVSGAENIYPREIEICLEAHPSVADCAVFGIPDERFGEVPAAHVVLASGSSVTEDELIAHCADNIARFKRPRLVRFVNALPRTPVGKLQKHLLRAPYWEGRGRRV